MIEPEAKNGKVQNSKTIICALHIRHCLLSTGLPRLRLDYFAFSSIRSPPRNFRTPRPIFDVENQFLLVFTIKWLIQYGGLGSACYKSLNLFKNFGCNFVKTEKIRTSGVIFQDQIKQTDSQVHLNETTNARDGFNGRSMSLSIIFV